MTCRITNLCTGRIFEITNQSLFSACFRPISPVKGSMIDLAPKTTGCPTIHRDQNRSYEYVYSWTSSRCNILSITRPATVVVQGRYAANDTLRDVNSVSERRGSVTSRRFLGNADPENLRCMSKVDSNLPMKELNAELAQFQQGNPHADQQWLCLNYLSVYRNKDCTYRLFAVRSSGLDDT